MATLVHRDYESRQPTRITAFADRIEFYSSGALPSVIGGDDGDFILQVKGDSMKDAGILDGDYVVVQQAESARNGEIVVALIEDEATVKRYYPEGDRVRFQPSNPRLKPIYVARDEFRETQIIGVVVGVYRRMN